MMLMQGPTASLPFAFSVNVGESGKLCVVVTWFIIKKSGILTDFILLSIKKKNSNRKFIIEELDDLGSSGPLIRVIRSHP